MWGQYGEVLCGISEVTLCGVNGIMVVKYCLGSWW